MLYKFKKITIFQIDEYKKQIAKLQAKLDSETKNYHHLELKIEALSIERDRLQLEQEEDLKTISDDFLDKIKFGQIAQESGSKIDEKPNSGTLERIPSSVKEHLLRLQHENSLLKSAINPTEDGERITASNLGDLKIMIEDLQVRSWQNHIYLASLLLL